MDEETKKKLLYGGGAIASIAALVIYMKSRSSGQSVSVPTRTPAGSGGTSADPTSAAQINAATQLAIAQGNQDLEREKIRAQYGVAAGQTEGAIAVARINAQAAFAKSAFGPGGAGTAALPAAIKAGGEVGTGLLDLIGKGFVALGRVLGIVPPEANPDAEYQAKIIAGSLGNIPSSGYAIPQLYSDSGNLLDADNPEANYFMGSLGGGSNDWFGSSPGDFNNYESAYAGGGEGSSYIGNYESAYGGGGDGGNLNPDYSDYSPEEESAMRGD